MSLSEEQNTKTDESLMEERSDSPEPSCVSLKSDQSMGHPYKFKERDRSTDPSCVSMKSDQSMGHPYKFKQQDHSTDLSCVSMKSDQSMGHPYKFKDGDCSTDLGIQDKESKVIRKTQNLESIFQELEHKVITLLKNELKRFRKLLSPDYPACTKREVEVEEDLQSVREGALKITLHVLKNMNHTDLANTLQNKVYLVSEYQQKLKSNLREKFKRVSEGISLYGSSTPLNEIYTELYITEGWSGDVNNEHENSRHLSPPIPTCLHSLLYLFPTLSITLDC
ncbi:hypothetical protein PDJAM_G00102070 [Pangasius djambal]|uniref:Uncharacterized protein n=1 Tax=Pangasius djambal TaxID=1691987 RepID=A0ACC5Z8G1_9TELE|nr:hypothetical protein [Pangasius djambal]